MAFPPNTVPPTIRAYVQALNLQPTDAFIIDRIGTGTRFIEAESLPAGTVGVAFEFLGGTPPVSSEVMGLVSFDFTVVFPGNFSDPLGIQQSYGVILIHPTGTFVATVQHNGSNIGTMTISPAGVYAFTTTSNLPVTFNAGDYMTIIAPSSTDATAANFAWTFVGVP